VQGLALDGSERVLEVGTGSGFLTACLAALAAHVTSIEIFEDLAEQARSNLEASATAGIDLRVGDLFAQSFSPQSFDAVIVTASVTEIPPTLIELLSPGGRLAIVRGRSPAMEAVVISKDESGGLTEQSIYETDLPRLIGAEDVPKFEF